MDATEKQKTSNATSSGIDVFRNLRQAITDPWEVLFLRTEGIHAHGYHREACQMAVHLAHQLLRDPPDLISPQATIMISNKLGEESGAIPKVSDFLRGEKYPCH